MRAKHELTEKDLKMQLEGILVKHKVISSHTSKNNSKRKK